MIKWLKKFLERRDATLSVNVPGLSLEGNMIPDSPEPELFWTKGCDFHSFEGTVSTISNAEENKHSLAFFSKTTVLLGKKTPTTVSWKIKVEPEYIEKFSCGYLLIACEREFGGLHSQRRGSKVSIFLNNCDIDKFQLLEKPQGHDDFFYVSRNDQPLNLEHLKTYKTIYTWSISKDRLLRNVSDQTVTVSIEESVYWDIDAVAIQCYVE